MTSRLFCAGDILWETVHEELRINIGASTCSQAGPGPHVRSEQLIAVRKKTAEAGLRCCLNVSLSRTVPDNGLILFLAQINCKSLSRSQTEVLGLELLKLQ